MTDPADDSDLTLIATTDLEDIRDCMRYVTQVHRGPAVSALGRKRIADLIQRVEEELKWR